MNMNSFIPVCLLRRLVYFYVYVGYGNVGFVLVDQWNI